MKVSVNTPSEIKRELIIEVPPETVEAAIKKETDNVRKKVQLSGFRKGKAPLQMIRSQYGPQIDATAIEDTINEQYREALIQENLVPLAPASISDMDYNPGEPLKFKASIEIEPTIEVSSWKGMSVEKEEIDISDDMVEGTIDRIKSRFATVKTKEEPAADGDQVLIDIAEVDPSSGMEIIGRKQEDRSLRIGENVYGPEFEKELIGLKKDDTKVIRRKIEPNLIVDPKQQPNQGPAEEAIRVTVKNVEEVELPELADELAKEMNYDTVEALRDGVRNNLKMQMEEAARDNFRNNLEREAVRLADPSAPEIMVERYLDNLMENIQKMSQGPVNLKKIREESGDNAAFKVKWFLLREYIIKSENISVTDDEIEEYLKKVSEENKLEYERVRIEYRSGEKRESLKNEQMDKKVYGFLEEKADIRIVKNQNSK